MPEPIPFYGILEDCQHCWHPTGVALMSYPAQYQEKCCHCGEVKYIRGSDNQEVGTHGKFAPNTPFRLFE